MVNKLSGIRDLQGALLVLEDMFSLPTAKVIEIAQEFKKTMVEGLEKSAGPLKMLPSFLGIPTGKETGAFVAVDFGGTNLRILLVRLENGKFEVINSKNLPLKDAVGRYDYTLETVTCKQLFDFVAQHVGNFMAEQMGKLAAKEPYNLGHTFSYPMQQESVNTAKLICWTKEMKTSGVEGEDINLLFTLALQRQGLENIKPVVVLNDTVGTLLVAAYGEAYADIGSICGTGHNTCYLEANPKKGKGPMIINIESGNFNRKLPITSYDEQLDQGSDKQGEQWLEKMVGGQYLGELARLIISDLGGKGLLFTGRRLNNSTFPYQPKSMSTEHLSKILSGNSLTELEDVWGISSLTVEEIEALRKVAALVVTRAARLVTVTYIGVLMHMDSQLVWKHTIAIDGSVYEKVPGFKETIRSTLDEVLKDKANQIKVVLAKDGSGVGAAIAAAMIGNEK